MPLNTSLVTSIKRNFASLRSDELQIIMTVRDEAQWSEEAFEAARQLLDERGRGTAPEPATLSPADNAWRDGEVAILRDAAALPPRCVRCNAAVASDRPLRTDSPLERAGCCVCPHHLRRDAQARHAYRWGLRIGAAAITALFFWLDGPFNWPVRVTLAVGVHGLGIAVYVLWVGTVAILYSRAWSLAKFQVLRLLPLVASLAVALLVAVGWVLAAGWEQGFYLLTALGALPPVVGVVALARFKLRVAVVPSDSGFVTVLGTGRKFRASLPAWPRLPRAAPIATPGDVGQSRYV